MIKSYGINTSSIFINIISLSIVWPMQPVETGIFDEIESSEKKNKSRCVFSLIFLSSNVRCVFVCVRACGICRMATSKQIKQRKRILDESLILSNN